MTLKHLFITTTLLLTSALTLAEPTDTTNRKAVEVDFFSIGSGINGGLKKKVLSIIANDLKNGLVTQTTKKVWGLEGESTHCVQYSSNELAIQAFSKIYDLIRDETDSRSDVKLRTDCPRAEAD